LIDFRLLLFTILMVIFTIPAHSTTSKVYVWRNQDGTLVFSDNPPPGSEEVKKNSSNVLTSSRIKTKEIDINPKLIEHEIKVIIKSPKNNSTIRHKKGSVYISGGVMPKFELGQTIQLYFDNKKHQKPQIRSIFSLQNVKAGQHTIKMDLLDDKGKVIASSKSVTFYMQRVPVN